MLEKFIWVAFNYSLDSSEEAIALADGEVREEREVASFLLGQSGIYIGL